MGCVVWNQKRNSSRTLSLRVCVAWYVWKHVISAKFTFILLIYLQGCNTCSLGKWIDCLFHNRFCLFWLECFCTAPELLLLWATNNVVVILSVALFTLMQKFEAHVCVCDEHLFIYIYFSHQDTQFNMKINGERLEMGSTSCTPTNGGVNFCNRSNQLSNPKRMNSTRTCEYGWMAEKN